MSSLGDLLLAHKNNNKVDKRKRTPSPEPTEVKGESSPIEDKELNPEKVFPDRVEKNIVQDDARSDASSTDDYVRELLDPDDRPKNVWHVVEGPKVQNDDESEAQDSHNQVNPNNEDPVSAQSADVESNNSEFTESKSGNIQREDAITHDGDMDDQSSDPIKDRPEEERLEMTIERSSSRRDGRRRESSHRRGSPSSRHHDRHRDRRRDREYDRDDRTLDRSGRERVSKDRDRVSRDHDRVKDLDRVSKEPDRVSKDRDRVNRDRERGSRDRERGSKDRERSRDHRVRDDRERSRDRHRSRRRHDYTDVDAEDDDVRRHRSRRDRRRSRSRSKGSSRHRDRSRSESQSPITKRNSRTILIMQLSPRVDSRDLEDFFSTIGRVREVRLIMDSKTRRHKGIAYIEFEDASSAAKASALNGEEFQGAPMVIQSAQIDRNKSSDWGSSTPQLLNPTSSHQSSRSHLPPNCYRVYVGGLHVNLTEDMIRSVFEPFGPIIRLELMKDRVTNVSRGYAFITYADIEDGQSAVQALDGFELAGKALRVSKSTDK